MASDGNSCVLYALRREVLRNTRSSQRSSSRTWTSFYTPFGVRCFGTRGGSREFGEFACFYTPFGVRCFGTAGYDDLPAVQRGRFYTPFGVRCFGTITQVQQLASRLARSCSSFYTPFGVRCFGTVLPNYCSVRGCMSSFYTPFGVRCFGTRAVALTAVRRVEIVRRFLYALRREVLRNQIPLLAWPQPSRSFYTPFGVRCFGTRPPRLTVALMRSRFYTPFGVRCFGTVDATAAYTDIVATDARVSIRPSA